MPLKPFALLKSPSRPSFRKSPKASRSPAGARCSANTSLSTHKSLIISYRDFGTVEDGYKDANHNPVVVVNGDSTKEPVVLKAKVGTPVVLSAAGTQDPDGNTLSYRWFSYPEATSAISKAIPAEEVVGRRGEDELNVPPKLTIENESAVEVKVLPRLPGVTHIILAVEDDGEPSLTSYRRIILEIEE
jgi:hypothetical protein